MKNEDKDPTHGGSFLRQADGSLVELPADWADTDNTGGDHDGTVQPQSSDPR